MALAMADMAIYSHKGEECLLAHETSNEIRRKLRDEFGLNLDRFGERARELFTSIYAERKKKHDEEAERSKQIQELLGDS